MKLFIGRELKNLNGDILKNGNGPDATGITLGEVCVTALITDTQNDANSPSDKKFHRWNVARRIKKAIDSEIYTIDVPVEDVDLIKKRISVVFQTQTLGPAYDAIENPESNEDVAVISKSGAI